MPVTVSQLAIAPVKGMRLHCTDEIRVGPRGVTGDREFLVIGADGNLLLTTRTPALMQVQPAWDKARDALALRFPDGNVVEGTPEPGAPAVTRMYDGREVPGRIIPGPLSDALSGFLGREVRLFRREEGQTGPDDYPVSLMSEASLQALAAELGGGVPDQRRFRMTITMTGTDPWAEHGWSGLKVCAGEAVLRVIAPVPRCVVTTRNPDSGATDADSACPGPAARQQRPHLRRLG